MVQLKQKISFTGAVLMIAVIVEKFELRDNQREEEQRAQWKVRGDSSGVLFDEREGLAALAHGVQRAAPIDARVALAKRVLVVGGGSLIPGLETRLLDELRARGVKDAGELTAPCASCDAAWVGASLLAASTTLTGAAKGDRLPDIFEMKVGLPAVVAPQCGV